MYHHYAHTSLVMDVKSETVTHVHERMFLTTRPTSGRCKQYWYMYAAHACSTCMQHMSVDDFSTHITSLELLLLTMIPGVANPP
jgi:hypothetical protein